jgi:tetratricopeptide (TPR) repeat protein
LTVPDHILYTEWDPIGVHLLADYDCFDEYHSYLPGIVDMLREDASLPELSDRLMKVESYMFGPNTIHRRRCDVIAVMMTRYGPHAAKHPFVLNINTDTVGTAYQSVLDLVTQTRLDAYENMWDEVCCGYEKAVEICHAYLPRRVILVGACLNNLGHAYTITGQLDKARTALEQAAFRLKPNQYNVKMTNRKTLDLQLYESCLENLVTHLTYRGERLAAVRYARALVSYSIKRYGKRTGQTQEARQRLHRIILREQSPAPLRYARVSVEQDGCGAIRHMILCE